MTVRAKIWLADLTYTQQTISSDVMPAAVGCIATYAEKYLRSSPEIRIFKMPEKLAEALEKDTPHVIGFSNYAWNEDLSTQFARVIKRKRPEVVTIFGGPNYPTEAAEQESFLRAYPMIDFYIVKEGEVAFSKLLEALEACDFNKDLVPENLFSVHRITGDDIFIAALTMDRLKDLSEIPSPYLTGKMDEFFDGFMLPIIQTNRGCPFFCTFCVEGVDYYNKVAKTKTLQKVFDELEYIAARMARLRDQNRGRTDLHIADSNFGMYREDIEICRHIARMQEQYRYPQYINVATGKNHKERVLEAASLTGGALRLSGSVQTLDDQVLTNIKRSNISKDQIVALALDASAIGANSYSEIILGLPGDSIEAHFKSIRTIVEADFNTVCLYQLMLLPGTELATEESVKQWEMRVQYRAIPRCYGYYDCLGEEINAAEIEKVCIANNSLTFKQYLECRHMHLIINLFYNDGVFKEALRMIKGQGLSVYEWLDRLYKHSSNARLVELVSSFLKDTEAELWRTKEELRTFARERSNVKKFIDGELGANLIFKYRSLVLLEYVADLSAVAIETMREMFASHGIKDSTTALACELIKFAELRMTDLFKPHAPAPTHVFSFDVISFIDGADGGHPDLFKLPCPVELRFVHSVDQVQTIEDFTRVYGDSLAGLSRILAKVYVGRLFRSPESFMDLRNHVSGRSIQIGQTALSGLNEFS